MATNTNPTSGPAPMVPQIPADRPIEPAPPRLTFPLKCRILRGADFQRAYRRRCVASDETIILHGCENGFDYPRLGLSVSRKVGGAVVRNRWKRLLREAFRLSRRELPRGVDLVMVPRPQAKPDLTQLLRSLPELARRVERKLHRSRR